MLSLFQSPLASEHALEAVGLIGAYAIKAVWDHKKGKPRDSSQRRIENAVNALTEDVRVVRVDVVKLQAKLENGLSDDIKELKSDVKAINARELERASQYHPHHQGRPGGASL